MTNKEIGIKTGIGFYQKIMTIGKLTLAAPGKAAQPEGAIESRISAQTQYLLSDNTYTPGL